MTKYEIKVMELKKELRLAPPKKRKRLIKEINNLLLHNVKKKPLTEQEKLEHRAWDKATGWVNKRKEDPEFIERARQRVCEEMPTEPTSMGMAAWTYNKEEYIKEKQREELLQERMYDRTRNKRKD